MDPELRDAELGDAPEVVKAPKPWRKMPAARPAGGMGDEIALPGAPRRDRGQIEAQQFPACLFRRPEFPDLEIWLPDRPN